MNERQDSGHRRSSGSLDPMPAVAAAASSLKRLCRQSPGQHALIPLSLTARRRICRSLGRRERKMRGLSMIDRQHEKLRMLCSHSQPLFPSPVKGLMAAKSDQNTVIVTTLFSPLTLLICPQKESPSHSRQSHGWATKWGVCNV